MRPYRPTRTLLAVIVVTLAMPLGAQEPAPPVPPPQPGNAQPRAARAPLVPLEVQVVISRYQGDKRVSSMPYVLVVNANAQAAIELNMGAEVPIPSTAFVPAAGDTKAQPPALRSFNYRNIGTNIVSRASSAEDGRFELTINIDESSVYTKEDGPAASSVGDMPVFRSFKSRNMLLLRDGQTRQYTAATDRASGETLKIDVTLKVLK